MKRGEFYYTVSNTNPLAIKWKDGPRYLKEEIMTAQMYLLSLILEHNNDMNFIDNFTTSTVMTTVSTVRTNGKYVYFHYVDAFITNAYVIYKQLKLHLL